MRDLNDLYYFVQVVDHQGFAPAGRALGMPKSKLSRRIAALEEQLGVRLIHRSTSGFAVTEIGHEYYNHCVAMLVEASAAQEVIERQTSEPQGIVHLCCPTALLDYQIGDMLARFMVINPRVELQVESTNRRVDVIREGFDLALRVRFPPLEDTDLVMKVLGESTQRVVASPTLLEGFKRPPRPRDFATLPSLAEGPAQRDHAWELQGVDGSLAIVRHKPRMVTDDRLALRLAALRGVGVVQLPTMMIQDDLREGRLMDVLPDWRPRPGIVHVVFPSRRGLLPAVRALIDFLAKEFPSVAPADDFAGSKARKSPRRNAR